MRMDPDSASWQFSLGERIVLTGQPIAIQGTQMSIRHVTRNGDRNLALCQLACLQANCDFFAYSDAICIMMNWGHLQVNPRNMFHVSGANEIHSVMVNMANWNDYDAGGWVCFKSVGSELVVGEIVAATVPQGKER